VSGRDFIWTLFDLVRAEDPRSHEGPVPYMRCSSGGKPVSLDLQFIRKEEVTSHPVPRAGTGGDSRWPWRVPLWEMCVSVGEGGSV